MSRLRSSRGKLKTKKFTWNNPKAFHRPEGKAAKVMRLLRALYGPKQAHTAMVERARKPSWKTMGFPPSILQRQSFYLQNILLGQHHQKSQNGCCVWLYKKFRVGWDEIDGGDRDRIQIRNGKGAVGWDRRVSPNMVEYPKENTTGVSPSAHIRFYILCYIYFKNVLIHATGTVRVQACTQYY